MATHTPPEKGTTRNGLVPYRLTVRQFLAIIEAGVFPEGRRVELIRGRLVERMTTHTPHNFAVGSLAEMLRRLVAPGWIVREEKSLVVGRDSRPEPDILVARGPSDRYRARDPEAQDVALVVEVSDSTYIKDRGPMWRLYAGAGIPFYGIVNIGQRQVEVFTGPSGQGLSAEYSGAEVFGLDAEIPVVIEGNEAGKVACKDILP
jgi:Uma2 family endonuclease